MTKLTNTVKFRVEIFDDREGTVWTQEFIKPLVNYTVLTSNGWETLKFRETPEQVLGKGMNGQCIGFYDLFNDEFTHTINTYATEIGESFHSVLSQIRGDDGFLRCYIEVSPKDDDIYSNDGYFDFFKDRCEGTETYKEVERLYSARMMEIREEYGWVSIIGKKEVA